MTEPPRKPLMRSLGEFCGHIAKAVKTDPQRRTTLRKTTEQQDRSGIILRRTTIEEIEFRDQTRHR